MRAFAFALALALALALPVSSFLRQTKWFLDTASFLELNVDGVRGLVACGSDPYSIPPQLWTKGEKQAAQLPLESFVEVKVNERVVDVGAFSKEGRENKALRSHVPVLLMKNEEEGHNCVWSPCNHKAQADAEKHLEKEVIEGSLLQELMQPCKKHTLGKRNESLCS